MGREESGVWRVTDFDGRSPQEIARVVAATLAWLGACAEDAILRFLPKRAGAAQGQQ